MTSAYPPVVNVAHVADGQGKCSRCHASIGEFVQVADADARNAKGEVEPLPAINRPWYFQQRVIEYDCADGRSRFADQVTGFTVDCQP